jgi:hypothetical protein
LSSGSHALEVHQVIGHLIFLAQICRYIETNYQPSYGQYYKRISDRHAVRMLISAGFKIGRELFACK